jgi:hypothetical protein
LLELVQRNASQVQLASAEHKLVVRKQALHKQAVLQQLASVAHTQLAFALVAVQALAQVFLLPLADDSTGQHTTALYDHLILLA